MNCFKRVASNPSPEMTTEQLFEEQKVRTVALLSKFSDLCARYKQENVKSPVLRSEELKELENVFIARFDAAVRDVRLPFSVAFMLLLPYSHAEQSGDAKTKKYIETLVDDYSYAYTRKMLRGLSATLTPGISTRQTEGPKPPKVDMSPYGSLVTLVGQLAAQEGRDVSLPDTRNSVTRFFDAIRLVTPGQGSIKNSVLFELLGEYKEAQEAVHHCQRHIHYCEKQIRDLMHARPQSLSPGMGHWNDDEYVDGYPGLYTSQQAHDELTRACIQDVTNQQKAHSTKLAQAKQKKVAIKARLESETIYKGGLLDRLLDFPEFLKSEYHSLQKAVVEFRMSQCDFRDAASICTSPNLAQDLKDTYLKMFLEKATPKQKTSFFKKLLRQYGEKPSDWANSPMAAILKVCISEGKGILDLLTANCGEITYLNIPIKLGSRYPYTQSLVRYILEQDPTGATFEKMAPSDRNEANHFEFVLGALVVDKRASDTVVMGVFDTYDRGLWPSWAANRHPIYVQLLAEHRPNALKALFGGPNVALSDTAKLAYLTERYMTGDASWPCPTVNLFQIHPSDLNTVVFSPGRLRMYPHKDEFQANSWAAAREFESQIATDRSCLAQLHVCLDPITEGKFAPKAYPIASRKVIVG